MIRFILFLLVFCIHLLPMAATFASITHINAPKCNGTPVIIQGRSNDYIITGRWVDWAGNKSSVSGAGVTLSVLGKRAAGENSTVTIRLIASNNAATGNRTVTLRYPTGEDRFTIRVMRRARINRSPVPTFTQPFQNNVDVRLEGVGLSNVTVAQAVIKSDSFNPTLDAGGQPLTGGVGVTAVVNQQSNTNSRAVVRLNFTRRLTRAQVEITLRSRDGCGGIGTFRSGNNTFPHELTRTVTITAPATGPNYVDEITFPFGSSFTVGSVATIEVKLERPVKAAPVFTRKRPVIIRNKGDVVYWKLIPANAFEQAPGGTPYNPNAFNKITIPPGDESQRITVGVKQSPGNNSGSNTVKIQTWRLNTNTTQPPEFKEQLFTVIPRR